MTFYTIKDFFKFSREQRLGIVLLFSIIVILQLIYLCTDFSTIIKDHPERQKWLSLQSQVDVAKRQGLKKNPRMNPFNPNFISDYKGYKLGMSVQEIDRLLEFRKNNKFVNSPKEFQEVTKVSDSLLLVMSPFFKFPNWIKQKNEYKYTQNSAFAKSKKIVLIDINQATKEDLIKINGIGEVISLRILDQKEKLGGFVSMKQLNDVWGLSPEVVMNLNKYFKIEKFPDLKKINVNTASLKELSHFFYFKYDLAKQIVKHRSMYGDIRNIEDLIKINGFPVEKANFIALYLDF